MKDRSLKRSSLLPLNPVPNFQSFNILLHPRPQLRLVHLVSVRCGLCAVKIRDLELTETPATLNTD